MKTEETLVCQGCKKCIENRLIFLSDHLLNHGIVYEYDAEQGEDIDQWVLSYFDSVN